MTNVLKGHCLCGAVQVTARSHDDAVSACHCSMCRRWAGSVMWVLMAPEVDVDVTGPVKTFRSSSFAERAWCDTCGTQLWIKDDGAGYEFMPGLFDGARDLPLSHEIYADQAFASMALADDHKRYTRAEYEARERHVEGFS